MNLKYFKIPFLSALILFGACKKETIDLDKMPDPDRNYGVSIPLAQVYFTMGALVEKVDTSNYLSIEEDGLIVRKYYETFEMELESIVDLNNVNYSIALPFANSGTQGSNNVSQTIINKYVLNERPEARYDSVYLESGLLNIDNLNYPAGSTGTITFEIPELYTPSGNSFSYTSNINEFTPQSFNLDDYKIQFSTGVDSSYVTLITNINIDLPNSPGAGVIGVDFGMNDLIAEVTFGYFGNYSETLLDSMEFDVFDANEVYDAVELANVYVDVNTKNSVGCPFNIELDSIVFSKDGSLPKQLELANNILSIESATYAQPVISSEQKFEYDKTNSNILTIIDELPNWVTTKMTATTNPEGNANTVNFFHHYNQLEADLGIIFPLHFKAEDYQRVDTLDLDFNEEFGDSDLTDALDHINLFLDVYNGLPFEITLESVVAKDGNDIDIDYLIKSPGENIASAVPDENGYVSETVYSEIILTLDKEQIQKFRDQDMKYLVLKTKGVSYGAENNGYIKIFNDNVLKIVLSAEINGNIPND
nr:hypothetical protein [uncultured Carboxylicivirga sp.]